MPPVTAFVGQLWPCLLQVLMTLFPKGLLPGPPPLCWLGWGLPSSPSLGPQGCESDFTSEQGWFLHTRWEKWVGAPHSQRAAVENTSQGASGPGNSLYRFFKRVPDMEELCEGPIPTHLLLGEAQ